MVEYSRSMTTGRMEQVVAAVSPDDEQETSVARVTVMGDQRKPVNVQLVESSSNPGGRQLIDASRVTKCGDQTDLVELAKQIQKAEEFVRARAHGRLEVIAEQMRFLQEQAARVLKEAKLDDQLHHAACNMKKVPGTIYYLYKRKSGQEYMSLISSQEWGKTCPHDFIGAFRLEHDMSWTLEKNLDKRTGDIQFLDSVLEANRTLLPSIEGAMKPQAVLME